MSIRRVAVALLALGLLGVACASEETSPPRAAAVPMACLDLPAAQCDRAVEIVEGHRAGATLTYITVAPRVCDEPCPGKGRGALFANVTIEYADGRPPSLVIVGEDGPVVTFQPLEIEGFLVRVDPASGRVSAPITQLTLGHCGLNSPIDVDGSLWDPVGMIDQTHPDVINGAAATFNLTAPMVATLRTQGGAEVQLVRHTGARYYPGCD